MKLGTVIVLIASSAEPILCSDHDFWGQTTDVVLFATLVKRSPMDRGTTAIRQGQRAHTGSTPSPGSSGRTSPAPSRSRTSPEPSTRGRTSPSQSLTKADQPAPKRARVSAHLQGPSSVAVMKGNDILGSTLVKAKENEFLYRTFSDPHRLWTAVESQAGGRVTIEGQGKKGYTKSEPKEGADAFSESESFSPNSLYKSKKAFRGGASEVKAVAHSANDDVFVRGRIAGGGKAELIASNSPSNSPPPSPGHLPPNNPLAQRRTHGI